MITNQEKGLAVVNIWKEQSMKPYLRYANDVTSGKIVVGGNIKLAIQRFQMDLQRDDLEFREDVVDGAIDFISTLKHFTGKSSG